MPIPKSFNFKTVLERHVSVQHKNHRFKCDYAGCRKEFTSKNNLQNHVSSKHDELRFKCEYQDCRKSYSSKSTLKKHVFGCHQNNIFLCEYLDCEKSYTSEDSLRNRVGVVFIGYSILHEKLHAVCSLSHYTACSMQYTASKTARRSTKNTMFYIPHHPWIEPITAFGN